MARTHIARPMQTGGVLHDDDGELLDKEGQPINPIVNHGAVQPEVDHDVTGSVAEPPPPVPASDFRVVHIADEKSLRRDMEAWELGQLIKLIMGEWSVRVPDAEFMRLAPDLRRHFRRTLEPTE